MMGISKGSFEQGGVISKLLLLFAITILFTLLVLPVISLLTISNPSDISSLKLSQFILSTSAFVLPPFVLAYLVSIHPLKYLYLDVKKINPVDIFYVVLFMIILIPCINLLGELNHQIVIPKIFTGVEEWMKNSEEQASQFTEKLLNVHSWLGLILNVLLIAVLPAIGEELYFRGALQGVIKDWKGIRVSIWITAIIFSTIHFQFYGFVPRMLLGAFFGYLLFWSENMWLPMVGHFINNVIAIIFYYLKFNGIKVPDIDSIGFGNTLWMGIASGAIGIFGFFFLKRRFLLQKEKTGNV